MILLWAGDVIRTESKDESAESSCSVSGKIDADQPADRYLNPSNLPCKSCCSSRRHLQICPRSTFHTVITTRPGGGKRRAAKSWSLFPGLDLKGRSCSTATFSFWNKYKFMPGGLFWVKNLIKKTLGSREPLCILAKSPFSHHSWSYTHVK